MRLGTFYRLLVATKLNLSLDGDRVLDIGCYDGFLLSTVKAKVKVGIDLETVNRFSDVQYIQDDFMNHNFGNEKFDRIFAFDVLEHVKKDSIFIKKLISLLSTGGVAILSVPSKSIRIFPPFLQPWVDKKWGHIYRRGYEFQDVNNLLSDDNRKLNINIILWNCPVFRFSYLILSFIWRLMPYVNRCILSFITFVDSYYKTGHSGFYFIVITR